MNAFGSGQSPNSEFFSPSMTLFSNLILNDDLRSLQADDKKNICFSARICKWSCKRSRFIILIGKPPSCQCFVHERNHINHPAVGAMVVAHQPKQHSIKWHFPILWCYEPSGHREAPGRGAHMLSPMPPGKSQGLAGVCLQ